MRYYVLRSRVTDDTANTWAYASSQTFENAHAAALWAADQMASHGTEGRIAYRIIPAELDDTGHG